MYHQGRIRGIRIRVNFGSYKSYLKSSIESLFSLTKSIMEIMLDACLIEAFSNAQIIWKRGDLGFGGLLEL